MAQIYKVFKETKPFILHNIPLYLSDLDNYMYIKVEFPEDFKTILESFWESDDLKGISVYCNKLDNVLEEIKSFFKFVKAAGGVVSNPQNELLIIKRNGFLDLPKGHFKKNEKPQQAALREVAEECGISTHSINNDKPQFTYHIYEENGDKIIKETQWFEMRARGDEPLIPQLEEGIEEAFWMPEIEVNQKINLFYPSLVDLLGGAFQ
jgi:8-oxo-dGTP pyrophosphatase MutT (NUDIX family)